MSQNIRPYNQHECELLVGDSVRSKADRFVVSVSAFMYGKIHLSHTDMKTYFPEELLADYEMINGCPCGVVEHDILHGLKTKPSLFPNAVHELIRQDFAESIRSQLAADKLPITEEWLISVGFVRSDIVGHGHCVQITNADGLHLFLSPGRWLTNDNPRDTWGTAISGSRVEFSTRRDVRILCELLRIPLKEYPASVASASSE